MAEFTASAKDKIKRAVTSVLNQPTDFSGDRSTHQNGLNVITAYLSSRSTSDPTMYAWQQQRRKGTTWLAVVGGLSGVVTPNVARPAIDPQATRGVDLTGQYVVLTRGTYFDASNVLQPCWYIASSPLPVTRPKYTVLMPVNDQGDLAFDRPRFT